MPQPRALTLARVYANSLLPFDPQARPPAPRSTHAEQARAATVMHQEEVKRRQVG